MTTGRATADPPSPAGHAPGLFLPNPKSARPPPPPPFRDGSRRFSFRFPHLPFPSGGAEQRLRGWSSGDAKQWLRAWPASSSGAGEEASGEATGRGDQQGTRRRERRPRDKVPSRQSLLHSPTQAATRMLRMKQ